MIWNRTAFIQQIPSLQSKASANKVSGFLELTFLWESQATIPVTRSHVSVLKRVRWWRDRTNRGGDPFRQVDKEGDL